MQILGHAVITPTAKVPLSTCGYNVPIKMAPTNSLESSAQQIRTLSCSNPICSIQMYLLIFQFLRNYYRDSRPPKHETHKCPLPSGPAFRETPDELHLTFPGKGDRCGHASLVHLSGRRGFLRAPVTLFSGFYYVVLKLLLRQFSTVF